MVWENFRNDKAAYQELCKQLSARQQGLCIYCEQRLVDGEGTLILLDYQVEHVLAKSGGVGRVLDWTNLALACWGGTYPHHKDESRRYTSKDNVSCGQTKGDDELTPGCDPRTYSLLHELVSVGLDGVLSVNASQCEAMGVDPANVKKVIELLQLNCERLRMARQNIGDQDRKWFTFMVKDLADRNLSNEQKRQMLALLVAAQLQPDAVGALLPFWSTKRSAIGAPAETWLVSNDQLYL
jgi:uncharacterized protein (TIGR02646 family)